MKLSEIQGKAQDLSDNYDIKYFSVDMRDVIKFEVSNDWINNRDVLRVMFKVKK